MEPNEIVLWLRGENFEIDPFKCTKHLWEHQGWDFVDSKCSSIQLIARCAFCGKIAYGVKEYKAVGRNSFDLEDEKLIKSGLLGQHWIDRKYKQDTKKL
jgi:hypothetical protein